MRQAEPHRAFCRAVGLWYALLALPLALLLAVALAGFTAVANGLTRGRACADPLWPVTRWCAFAMTLPQVVARCEQAVASPPRSTSPPA